MNNIHLKSKWGNHEIYTFDIKKHNFINFFKKLYKTEKLDMLHLKSDDYNKVKDTLDLGYLNDRDTDLHKIFYDQIKKDDKFKTLYCNLIKDIHKKFFYDEEYILYQSFPSIRIQYMKSKVIPPHKDSDKLSNHPLGEKNFLIPITTMKKTNSLYIESEPDKKDFKSIELHYGDLFYFNGNTCTHYNEKNIENKLRISLDFRVILKSEYFKYLSLNNIISSNPRDIFWNRKPKLMQAGGYYQITNKNENLQHMMKWLNINENIMQHRPNFNQEEALACYNYMIEDNFITEHKKTTELESILCKYLNCKHCIMTTSGTTAIILSLMSLDLNEGDEVIVPNYTMIATVNAVKFLKLNPIIIDVDKETCTLDYNEIEKHITEKTKCVIHVSLNNRYKNMDKIVKLCEDKNLILIEDSAQSLGCKINGVNLGNFGKIGCFSLSTPKIISTGQGGFCITNDDLLAKKIRMIKNFGRRESGKDNFETFGINLKFTDIQAVIGIEQMKKLDYRVKRMREIYNLYYNNLSEKYNMIPPLNEEWIPWFVDIYIKDREDVIDFLKKHKISTRPVYGEINKTNIYNNNKNYKNSNFICNHGLFLPSYVTITDTEILYICKLLNLYIN